MKNRIALFLTCILLIQGAAGYAQSEYPHLKVDDDITLVQLSSKTFVHISVAEMQGFGMVSSNGLVLVDEDEAFLFDTPVTLDQTERLVAFIEDSLQARVIGFVPNHWHGDCMGGLEYIHNCGIASYANQRTIAIAKSNGLPEAKNSFDDSITLQIKGITIECYYFGGAHSTDNIVVWIPSEKILFPGCMVKEMNAQTLGNLTDADVKMWPETIQRVIDKFPEAEIVIPGHGQFGGKELLLHTLKLARDIK